eukprot:SAG31_NODE_2065_length_6530_cov_22.048515_3_plen_226_part_00
MSGCNSRSYTGDETHSPLDLTDTTGLDPASIWEHTRLRSSIDAGSMVAAQHETVATACGYITSELEELGATDMISARAAAAAPEPAAGWVGIGRHPQTLPHTTRSQLVACAKPEARRGPVVMRLPVLSHVSHSLATQGARVNTPNNLDHRTKFTTTTIRRQINPRCSVPVALPYSCCQGMLGMCASNEVPLVQVGCQPRPHGRLQERHRDHQTISCICTCSPLWG